MSVAALTLDEPVLKVLLDHGLDANVTEGLGDPGASPLHVACQTMTWGDSMKHSFVFALLANTGHPLDKAIERGSSSLGHRVLQHKGDTTYGQLHIRQALGGAALRVVRLLLHTAATRTRLIVWGGRRRIIVPRRASATR